MATDAMRDAQSDCFSHAGGLPFAAGGPAMPTFGPMFNRILKFAAITFLATSAFSQTPPKYDPATETKVKGAVEQLKLVPPSGGKPVVYVALKGSPDAV